VGHPLVYLMRGVTAGSCLVAHLVIHWVEIAAPSQVLSASDPLKLKCGLCVDRLVCVTVCVCLCFDIFAWELVFQLLDILWCVLVVCGVTRYATHVFPNNGSFALA
jgi:hypothetical protein